MRVPSPPHTEHPSKRPCRTCCRPASDFVRRNQNRGRIGSVTIGVEDKGTAKERDALGAELQATRQKMQQLQEQTTQMMRDRTALNGQMNALRDELATKDAAIEAYKQGQTAVLGKLQQDFSSLSMQAAGAWARRCAVSPCSYRAACMRSAWGCAAMSGMQQASVHTLM
jgi:methylphosphotriester-DNA--protein-cysteine methyltransferase